MSREIKFRAWTGEEIINRGLHDRNWYNWNNKLVKGTHPNDKRELKVMQFTGLKDKNGKEIYEGDLLKCNGVTYKLIKHVSGAYELYEILEDVTSCTPYFLFKQHEILEVVGNIYENPNLIKQ